MKLLLDENLSPRLVSRLNLLFPGLTSGISIVTTDADSVDLAQHHGWPPKVVHLEQCDFPLRVIEDWLRRSAVRISEFGGNDAQGLLPLRFTPGIESREQG